MKTPKRTYVTSFLEWDDEFQGRLSSCQQRAYARWKRRNRIAQLKRTIARLEAENARLWDGFSRMSKRCAELYDTFIFDNHP